MSNCPHLFQFFSIQQYHFLMYLFPW